MAIDAPYPDQSWSGWGDPDAGAGPARTAILTLLRDGLGRHAPTARAPARSRTSRCRRSRLGRRRRGGAGRRGRRRARARRRRSADPPHARQVDARPAAHARRRRRRRPRPRRSFPGSHDEVLELLRICSERRIAVVPFGGGTSVVGGLEPAAGGFAGVVALDVRRLNALLVARRGVAGGRARAGSARARRPRRCWPSTATRSATSRSRSSTRRSAGSPPPAPAARPRPATAASTSSSLGLRVATPAGTLELGRAPKSAAGPGPAPADPRLGGRVRRDHVARRASAPGPGGARSTRAGGSSRSPPGATALRAPGPGRPAADRAAAVRRGRDGAQPGPPGELGSGAGGGCLAIVGYEGTAEDVRCRAGCARRSRAARVRRRRRRRRRRRGLGRATATAGPYLRDALLDAGALVETLETATFWSQLHGALRRGRGGAARVADRAGHAAGDPLPHLARISGRVPRCTSPSAARSSTTRRPVARGQGRGRRRDPRRRRLDQPPSRRRAAITATGYERGDRRLGVEIAACRQGRSSIPRWHPQPGRS